MFRRVRVRVFCMRIRTFIREWGKKGDGIPFAMILFFFWMNAEMEVYELDFRADKKAINALAQQQEEDDEDQYIDF